MQALCPWLRFTLALAFLSMRNTTAYVVGGAVMHHGALALDPRNFNGSSVEATDAAMALHYAALDAGSFIQSLEPDILLLITPHGLALPQMYLLYNNPTSEGSVSLDAWLTCSFPPCAYNASAEIDVQLTKQLESALAARGLNVVSLSGFGAPGKGTQPLPLGWAEVIPLYFIDRAASFSSSSSPSPSPSSTTSVSGPNNPLLADHRRRRLRSSSSSSRSTGMAVTYSGRIGDNGGRSGVAAAAAATENPTTSPRRPPRLVVLSIPSRRYDDSASMVPELLNMGAGLFTQLDSLDERVAVVVSGDLAHTWDPQGPYGFSEHAARFDAAAVQWARDLDRVALLKSATKNVREAKSCGFPGMVVLQGLLDQVKPDNVHSVMLEYGHPSYYGMMCAVFDFQGDA